MRSETESRAGDDAGTDASRSGAETGDAGQADDLKQGGRWPALAVCLVGGFMTVLDISIVNVALPDIRSSLGASADDLQWVLSGYALAFGLVLVPAGRLGDAHGRRMMFMIGLAMFTVTSALAGVATGPLWLIIARFAQGLASGTLNPQVAGLIQQLYRGSARGRAFGLLGAVIGISTAIGPLLGGALILAGGSTDGWRWVFYVNVPIGCSPCPPRGSCCRLRAIATGPGTGNGPGTARRMRRARWIRSASVCWAVPSSCYSCRSSRRSSGPAGAGGC